MKRYKYVCDHCGGEVIRARKKVTTKIFCNKKCFRQYATENAEYKVYQKIHPADRKNLKFNGTEVIPETKYLVGLMLYTIKIHPTYSLGSIKGTVWSSLAWDFYLDMMEREERSDIRGFQRSVQRYLKSQWLIWKYEVELHKGNGERVDAYYREINHQIAGQ